MRFQKTLISTIVMLLVAAATFAQPICGFDLMHQRSMKEDPAYRNAVQANEINVQRYIREHASELARGSSMTGVLYFNPVNVRALWERLKGRVKVEWPLEQMDYGMLEFAIRDCNGYILSFGQENEE